MIRRDHRQLALSMLTAASAKSIKFVLKQQYLADIIGFHFRFLEANLAFAFSLPVRCPAVRDRITQCQF